MKMILILAWRNLWRNKRRSLITISSVFFAVFFAVLMRAFQLGSYQNMVDNIVGSYTGYVQIHHKGFWEEQTLENSMEYTDDLKNEVLSIDGVTGISPRLESFALISSGEQTKGTAIIGIDPEKELERMDLKGRLTSGVIFGKDDPGLMIGEGLAEYFKVEVGDSLVLLGQGYHGISANGLYPISGVLKFANPELNKSIVFMPLSEAQYLYGAMGRLTSLTLQIDENADFRDVVRKANVKLDTSRYEVMGWEELLPELKQTIEADSAGGQIYLFVLYFIISFGLFGTVLMMTAERRHEFGILVAIGMKRRILAAITMVEALMMTILGALAGGLAILPIQIYFKMNPIHLLGEAGKALEEYGFEPIMPTSTDPTITLSHLGIVAFVALLCSLYAVVSIYKLNPMKAMRS